MMIVMVQMAGGLRRGLPSNGPPAVRLNAALEASAAGERMMMNPLAGMAHLRMQLRLPDRT